MDIETLYQHQDFYIVVKPADVSFNDETGKTGFFNSCCKFFNETLFPVHRLDKITSGLLILARNKTSAQWFQTAFENKLITKVYLALSNQKPKKKQGKVIGDMEKSRNKQWKLLKSNDNPAITQFHSLGFDNNGSSIRLFILKPLTGKTHQLRVAMKSLSSPILGDELYGGVQADRGYLHAYALMFDYKECQIRLKSLPSSGAQFEMLTDDMMKEPITKLGLEKLYE